MGGTIIICTDGSTRAEAALAAGVALLRPPERFVVVAVADAADPSVTMDASGMAGPTVSVEEFELERTASREAAAMAVERAAALVEHPVVETQVLEGPAGPTIIELATELGASAVVMGSRGRGGFRRALLGSVSDHVVRNAPCPVIVTQAKD